VVTAIFSGSEYGVVVLEDDKVVESKFCVIELNHSNTPPSIIVVMGVAEGVSSQEVFGTPAKPPYTTIAANPKPATVSRTCGLVNNFVMEWNILRIEAKEVAGGESPLEVNGLILP
jgi:hypothetical protein